MKILISEDSNFKFEGIKRGIQSVLENAEIKRVITAKESVIELIHNEYDILIQDMQLPINKNDRIDIKGGLYVLNQIKYRQIEVKHCICSSDEKSHQLMIEDKFSEIPFIDYSSNQFLNELKNFLTK